MFLTERQKHVIDIVQWIFIAVLAIVCTVVFIGNKKLETERRLKQEQVYTQIYDSRTIESLRKENAALYDSIARLAGLGEPEAAVVIRYKTRYVRDTIRAVEFVETEDSTYLYTENTDSVDTRVELSAKKLNWLSISTTLKGDMTIVNSTDGNQTQTSIQHPSNMDIEGVTTWHRKTTWKDRIGYGPSVGVGYGVINRKPDVFVGFTVTYDLSRRK